VSVVILLLLALSVENLVTLRIFVSKGWGSPIRKIKNLGLVAIGRFVPIVARMVIPLILVIGNMVSLRVITHLIAGPFLYSMLM